MISAFVFVSTLVFHTAHATSDLSSPATNFTRFPLHRIIGHDDGGLFTDGVASVEACTQLCINDRGCTSFEFGVSEKTKGHCLLSYDMRSTVNTATEFVDSASFDYFERTEPLSNVLTSFKDHGGWLKGQATGGVIVGITATACAQRCLHSAHCKSASFGMDSCLDAEGGHTGFTKASDNSPMTCNQIKLFCQRGFGGKHADSVQKKCPLGCSQVFGYCYEEPSCSNNGCKARCRDANGIHFTVDGEGLTCAAAAAKGLCLGEDDLAAASVRMKCPVSCRAAFDNANATHNAKSDFCPAPVGECLLSHSALHDDINDVIAENIGDSAVAEHHLGEDAPDHQLWLTWRPGWQYFGKKAELNDAPCRSGTASRTGSIPKGALSCAPCPAGTYSAISRTKCIACPVGYTSEAKSGDMHSCTSDVTIAAGGPSSPASSLSEQATYFNPGEVWAGTYTCDSAFGLVTDDHGRFEIRVVAEGKMIQTFQNRWTSGSYHMSYAKRPTLHALFAAQSGNWIRQPSNRSVVQTGVVTELQSATRHHLVGNISESSEGNVMFHGDMCSGRGHFTLTRTCSVGTKPTFVAGEHWVGSYECFENSHQDKFDIRRLDLMISDVTDTHVKAISQFSHADGLGSFRQIGAFDQESHRLHLIADGPSAWIKRPHSKWSTTDLDGFVTDDALIFQGSKNNEPICSCIGECKLGYFTGTKNMWRCPTSDQCPNADRIVDAAGTVGDWSVPCGPEPQLCSKFSVHRVCTPPNKPDTADAATANNACACNGQTDTAGRGGQCETQNSDVASSIYASRGLWCHVDPSCIIAGPGDASSTAGTATEGGVAKSGLWWARCTPETSTTRPETLPCTESDSVWEWSECVPSNDCDESMPTGTSSGTRMPSTSITSDCISTQIFSKTLSCMPETCTIALDDSNAMLSTTTWPATTMPSTPTMRVPTTVTVTSPTLAAASTTSPLTRHVNTSTQIAPAVTTTTSTQIAPAVTTTTSTHITPAVTTATHLTPSLSTPLMPPTPAVSSAGNVKPVEFDEQAAQSGFVEGSVPRDCNLECENGGICVLVRDSERCNDSAAPYYKPTCLCPLLSTATSTCFWGDRCEASTECPGETTRSCNPQPSAGKTEFWKAHPAGICSAESFPSACFDASAALFNSLAGTSNGPENDASSISEHKDGTSEATASMALTALVVCAIAFVVAGVAFFVLWNKYKNRADDVTPQSYVNPMYERSGNTTRRRRISSTASIVLGIEGPRAQLAMALADAEADYQRDMKLVEAASARTQVNSTYASAASSRANNLYATVEPLMDSSRMNDASALPPYSEDNPSRGQEDGCNKSESL